MEEFDYSFQETLNLLYEVFFNDHCIVQKDKIIYNLSEAIIYNLITNDEKIIPILMQKGKDAREIVSDVLELNEQRLKTKKAFHRYIENYCIAIPYTAYEEYYKDYCNEIEKFKREVYKIISRDVIYTIQELKEIERNERTIINFKDLDIKHYAKKEFISNLFENSINEARNVYERITKEDQRDYSKLNIIDDLRILWVKSIRDKRNEDAITKHFSNDAVLQKNTKNQYFIKGLPLRLAAMAKNNTKNKKLLIVGYLLSVFKDIKLVRALCVNGHDGVSPLMDKKTFNEKLKTKEITELTEIL